MDTYNKTKEQVLQGYEGYKETTIGLYNDAGELIEKTGNYLDDKGFKTDEEVKAEEAEKNRENEKENKIREIEDRLKEIELLSGNAKETAKMLLDILEGRIPDEITLTLFFESIRQSRGGGTTLQSELENIITGNPEAFREIMQKAGMNVNNPRDVETFARQTQGGQCVQLTMFVQGLVNGFPEPDSMGEYYKAAVQKGLVDERGMQKASTQKVFDEIYGEGKVEVIGYGKDRDGSSFAGTPSGDYSQRDVMTGFYEALENSGAGVITVRVNTGGGMHNMSVINNGDGSYTLYDTSYRQSSSSQKGINVDNKKFGQYISSDTIQSFYYIKKK